ncbi:hypothetical protein EI94DRAFT_1703029 [Lactarius quietus]|nr:hypothetical protein EI94DRAFT_1703029 [Lactarius quietus]
MTTWLMIDRKGPRANQAVAPGKTPDGDSDQGMRPVRSLEAASFLQGVAQRDLAVHAMDVDCVDGRWDVYQLCDGFFGRDLSPSAGYGTTHISLWEGICDTSQPDRSSLIYSISGKQSARYRVRSSGGAFPVATTSGGENCCHGEYATRIDLRKEGNEVTETSVIAVMIEADREKLCEKTSVDVVIVVAVVAAGREKLREVVAVPSDYKYAVGTIESIYVFAEESPKLLKSERMVSDTMAWFRARVGQELLDVEALAPVATGVPAG